MYVSLEKLRRAVRLTEILAGVDDSADFAAVALPALAELVGCDEFTYDTVDPAAAQATVGSDQIAVSLSISGSRVTGIAFTRARTGFTNTDRALLSVIAVPLLAAMQRVHDHELSGDLAGEAPPFEPDCLTCREEQILKLVAGGCTDEAIARQLGVSPRTVAKHLEHIYRKLGVANRAAAVSRLYQGLAS